MVSLRDFQNIKKKILLPLNFWTPSYIIKLPRIKFKIRHVSYSDIQSDSVNEYTAWLRNNISKVQEAANSVD